MSDDSAGHGRPSAVRLVVMGVSGSGKTTIGQRLAAELGSGFVDADAAHPRENIEKMARGEPLSDADRQPWLQRLRDELRRADGDVVVTSSALKRSYRDVLREAGDVSFVLLDVDRETATARVAGRSGHFMPARLVDSQFAALERPGIDEVDVLTVDASAPPDDIVDTVLAALAS